MKGMILGMRWLLSNKDAAVDSLAQELKLTPEYARRGSEFFKEKGIWDPQIDLNMKGMKTALQIYNEVNPTKPAGPTEKYIDLSFGREALKDLSGK